MILFAAWLTKGGQLPISFNPQSGQEPQISQTMKVGDKTIKVAIADTPDKQARGLSGRENLPENEGMLFVMDKNSTPVFWMKGMKFPIDIIWIQGTTVVAVTENIPIPSPLDNLDNTLPRYQPSNPVDYVLEVNAGFAKKNNVKEGTPVQLPQ